MKHNRKTVAAFIICMLMALIAFPVMADVDIVSIAEVQSRVDQAYYPKMGNGEFQQLVLEVTNQYGELSVCGVYFAGEHEDTLLRPAFFTLADLTKGTEKTPLDIQYVVLYVDVYFRNLLENAGMAYLNPDIIKSYYSRNGIKENGSELVFPTDIASYSSPEGLDVIVFGMVDYTAMSLQLNEMLVNWELYAIIRIPVEYDNMIVDNCYLITDQNDVRQVLAALNPEPDSLGGVWINR